MASPVFDAMRAIHASLCNRGFFSQFVGSMIQYRHPQKPELSLGLLIDEDPWRKAGKHGQFRYQLTNTTYVPQAALQEEAQDGLNELAVEGLTLHGGFDVSDFKDVIAPGAMHAMQSACRKGEGMHEAFKTYLKAVHDSLKQSENQTGSGKKPKTEAVAARSKRTK